MRKKCAECGFICFKSDESCKKCGSSELELVPVSESLNSATVISADNPMSFWNYVLNFGLAIFIEFLALLPILMFIGSHGKGTSDFEINMLRLVYILNLPSSFVFWFLQQAVHNDFILLNPLTQVIFWWWLLNFVTRRMKKGLK